MGYEYNCKIISTYKNEGFTNVRVSFDLKKSSLNNNILTFFIDEGERIKISKVEFSFSDNILNKSIGEFEVIINLHPEVQTQIVIKTVAQEEIK